MEREKPMIKDANRLVLLMRLRSKSQTDFAGTLMVLIASSTCYYTKAKPRDLEASAAQFAQNMTQMMLFRSVIAKWPMMGSACHLSLVEIL